MGSIPSSQLHSHHLSITQYLPHKDPTHLPRPQISSLLKHRQTHTLLQQYPLTLTDSQQLSRAFQFFQYRLRQPHIVNTMYFFFHSQKHLCSDSYSCSLYTERIPLRLKDIGEIPYPESLYVLDGVLRGFDGLSKMFGCFEVTQDLVGVDGEGRAKVWVNGNLGVSYPEGGVKEMEKGEMARRVVEMVMRNCDGSWENREVERWFRKEGIEDKGENGFDEGIRVLEKYIREKGIEKPDKFYCIMDILNGKQRGKSRSRTPIKRKSKQKISLNLSVEKNEVTKVNYKNSQKNRMQYAQSPQQNPRSRIQLCKYQPQPQYRHHTYQPQPRQNIFHQLHFPRSRNPTPNFHSPSHHTHTTQPSTNPPSHYSSQLTFKSPPSTISSLRPPNLSRDTSLKRVHQILSHKKVTIIPPLNLKDSSSHQENSTQKYKTNSQYLQNKIESTQTLHVPSKTSLLQIPLNTSNSFHSNKLKGGQNLMGFKAVESMSFKENLNRYVVSEEALIISEENIPYDEISYRTPDERFRIDSEIAKDMKVFGFR